MQRGEKEMIVTVTLNAAIDKRYVVDNYQIGEVNRVKQCSYSAGGKGLNVSRVLALAGADVLATGFLGGHAGDYIMEELAGMKIKADFIRTSGESRSCINIYDCSSGIQTEFLEPGAYISEQNQEDFLAKYIELIEQCSVVTISGSVPKGVESSFYGKLISSAKRLGKKVLLDTSGSLMRDSIHENPALIKPNLDEIQMLAGRKISDQKELIEFAKEIQKSGIEIVVVSLGKDGSLVVTEKEILQAKVPPITAVNTVGCGDSMIAGFAIGIEQGMALEDILRYASAISGSNALRMETGFFLKDDFDKLYPQIEIIHYN